MISLWVQSLVIQLPCLIYVGDHLFKVADYLASHQDLFSSVDIHFSHVNPFTNPVILNLAKNGIMLRFHPESLRLEAIQVFDWMHSFTFKGKEYM